jgi:hypothetical protein
VTPQPGSAPSPAPPVLDLALLEPSSSPSRFGIIGRLARRAIFRLARPVIHAQHDIDQNMLGTIALLASDRDSARGAIVSLESDRDTLLGAIASLESERLRMLEAIASLESRLEERMPPVVAVALRKQAERLARVEHELQSRAAVEPRGDGD